MSILIKGTNKEDLLRALLTFSGHEIVELPDHGDLEAALPVDAVPVVRCKDCKHYREGMALSSQKFCFRLRGRHGGAIGYNFADDDFCSYGERSEE